MLMDLGKPTYEADFERHFLAAAADFYAKEAQEFIASSNAPDYMLKVRSGGAAKACASCFCSTGVGLAALYCIVSRTASSNGGQA
jgi:hypothetical protein